MGPIESILLVVVCTVGVTFHFWSQRYFKNQAAKINKAEAYQQKKAAISAVLYPIVGLALIGIVLFNSKRLPPKNSGLTIVYVSIGVAMIFFGVYRWYKVRSRSHRS